MIRFNYRSDIPWRTFLAGLDFELLECGFGKKKDNWDLHQTFKGDIFFRFYLPVEGSFLLRYLDREIVVEPGSVYLVPPEIPFNFASITPSDHYWFHFSSVQLRNLPQLRTAQYMKIRNRVAYIKMMNRLMKKAVSAKSFLELEEVRHLSLNLVLPLLEKSLADTGFVSPDGNCFGHILDYIDGHLGEKIRISTLQRMTGFGRAAFSAEFNKVCGMPPLQYIMERRLTLAKYLLWRTRLSMKEIAFRCGFEDQKQFYRFFRRHSPHTPGEYRREHRFN